MLTINRSKSIAGKLELPPSPDLFLVAALAALASGRKTRISPIGSGAEIRRLADLIQGHAALAWEENACLIEPTGGEGDVTFVDDRIPYRDLVVFLALGAGKRVLFRSIREERLALWSALSNRLGVSLQVVESEGARGLVRLPVDSAAPLPALIEEADINAALGLFFGLGAKRNFRIGFSLSNPFRHLASAFGGTIEVKRDIGEKEKDPLLRRIALKTGKRLSSQEQTFLVNLDFSKNTDERSEPLEITLPGDELLFSLFCAAKAVIPRGSLVIDNAPLESWASPTLAFIRKMGCKPALQEHSESSFGAVGMVTLPKFDLAGQKIDFSPQQPCAYQLPAMAVVAAFAENESLFREFEDLRLYDPDAIRQLESCLKSMGVKFGDIPDGFVIKGEKEYDGFDLIEPLPACFAGAFAVAGMRCVGSTTVNDERLSERWPEFFDLITRLGAQNTTA